jgi:GAF domain-containing protein
LVATLLVEPYPLRLENVDLLDSELEVPSHRIDAAVVHAHRVANVCRILQLNAWEIDPVLILINTAYEAQRLTNFDHVYFCDVDVKSDTVGCFHAPKHVHFALKKITNLAKVESLNDKWVIFEDSIPDDLLQFVQSELGLSDAYSPELIAFCVVSGKLVLVLDTYVHQDFFQHLRILQSIADCLRFISLSQGEFPSISARSFVDLSPCLLEYLRVKLPQSKNFFAFISEDSQTCCEVIASDGNKYSFDFAQSIESKEDDVPELPEEIMIVLKELLRSNDPSSQTHTRKILAAKFLCNERVCVILSARLTPDDSQFSAGDIAYFLHSLVPKLLTRANESFNTLDVLSTHSHEMIEVMRSLSSQLDLDSLINATLGCIKKLTHADVVTLFLHDESSDELVKHNSDSAKSVVPIRIQKDTGIAGFCFNTRAVVNTEDAYRHERFNPTVDLKTGYRTKTLLCVPLIDLENKTIGVIQVINKLTKKKGNSSRDLLDQFDLFTMEDQKILDIFSSQIAICLTNSKLFQKVRHAQARNEFLVSFCREVSSQLQLKPLAQSILSNANVVLQNSICGLFLVHKDLNCWYRLSKESGIVEESPSSQELELIESVLKSKKSSFIHVKSGDSATMRTFYPLILGEQVLGLFEVEALSECQEMSPVESSLLDGIGVQSSIALQNSFLYSDVMKMRQYLEDVHKSINDYMITIDKSGKVLFSNKDLAGLFVPAGKSKTTTSASGNFKFLCGAFNEKMWKDIEKCLSNGQTGTFQDFMICKIAPAEFSKRSTGTKRFKDINLEEAGRVVNYTIVPLKAIDQSEQWDRVLLVITDVSDRSKLESKIDDYQESLGDYEKRLAEMEQSLSKLQGSVVTVSESPIQSALRILNETSTSPGLPASIRENLLSCVSLLRTQDLYKPTILAQSPSPEASDDEDGKLSDPNTPRGSISPDNVSSFLIHEFSKSAADRLGTIKKFKMRASGGTLDEQNSLKSLIAALPDPSLIGKLKSWDFDTLSEDAKNFVPWSVMMLSDMNLVHIFNLDVSKLLSFVTDIAKNYRNNPFHNFTHGFTVFQCMYHLLQGCFENSPTEKLNMTSLETLATMIACIGHDVDHRGRTNGFEVNTFSDLALLYNDQSVLENHHCSTTLRLLRKSENNFISNFSMDQVRDVWLAFVYVSELCSFARLLLLPLCIQI